jgi:hypothetical protein
MATVHDETRLDEPTAMTKDPAAPARPSSGKPPDGGSSD